MSLWTPPNLEQRIVTAQPAYALAAGGAGLPVEGVRLRVLATTLEKVIGMRLRVEQPAASGEALAGMQASALAAWYAYLNASWPDAPFALDDKTLQNPSLRCTIEFYHLADTYARSICATPTFAEQHAQELLRSTHRWWLRALPMRMLYAHAARSLTANSRLGLRMIGGTWQTATIQWQAAPEITSLPDDEQQAYLRANAAVYTSLFRTIPYSIAGSPRASITENLSMLDGGQSFIWEFSWEGGVTLLNPFSLSGFAITVFLIAAAYQSGNLWVAFLAFLPAILTLVWSYQHRLNRELGLREFELAQRITQAELQAAEMASVSQQLQHANESLRRQVEALTSIRKATLSMSTLLDEQALKDKIIEVITSLFNYDRVLILVNKPDEQVFGFGAISQPLQDAQNQFRLEHLEIPLKEAPDFPMLTHWLLGQSTLQDQANVRNNKPVAWLFNLLGDTSLFTVPLLAGAELLGVIIVDHHRSGQAFSEESNRLLEALAANISIALQNARLYQRTDAQLGQHVKELDIMRQVDVELMEALSWERVLNMIMDWGLRITGANSVSLAMADPEAQELRLVAGWGLDINDDDLKKRRIAYSQGIMGRVARTGSSIIIDDVRENQEHIALARDSAAHMSVPIRRRGRVIAVLNLESVLPGAFTHAHRDFVERLANRASVALDNARLFEETQREREKLSRIVDKTADIIIVVGFDR
ncbi:MAG: GAF domain-containing protein, partial [Anaerolineae bacterium]|nr:GAF domain-containing protein [Anaerolineae bacterium]